MKNIKQKFNVILSIIILLGIMPMGFAVTGARLAHLEGKLNAAGQKIEELEGKNCGSVVQERDACRQDLQNKEVENRKLFDNNKDLQNALDDAQEEKSDVEEKLLKCKSDEDDLRRQIGTVQGEKDQLVREKEVLEKNVTDTQLAKQQIEKQLETREKERNTCRQELQQVKEQNVNLFNNNKDLQRDVAAFNTTKVECQENLSNCNTELSNLQLQYDQLDNRAQEEGKLLVEANNNITQLQGALNRVQGELSNCEANRAMDQASRKECERLLECNYGKDWSNDWCERLLVADPSKVVYWNAKDAGGSFSASSQLNANVLARVGKAARLDNSHVAIFDVRQEPKVYVDGEPLSWWYVDGNYVPGSEEKALIQELANSKDAIEAMEILTEDLGQILCAREKTIFNDSGIPVEVLSEKELVKKLGYYEYHHAPTPANGIPEAEIVDKAVEFLTNNKNIWVHFHSRSGSDRATLWMAIAYMLQNRESILNGTLSLEAVREYVGPTDMGGAGGIDLLKPESESDLMDPWQVLKEEQRRFFLFHFYNYLYGYQATDNLSKDGNKWSDYVATLCQDKCLINVFPSPYAVEFIKERLINQYPDKGDDKPYLSELKFKAMAPRCKK